MSLDLSLNFPDFKIGMDDVGNNGVYEFDRFVLDSKKLMLYRDGAEVSLPPKMIKTLAVLVERSGTIVSKNELLDLVWSDTIVDESNLSQHLYHLRKVLGKLPDGGSYIETLRRRGYRFNGVVNPPRNAEVTVEVPTISSSVSSRTSVVERDGNVLRLVDWSNSSHRPREGFASETDSIEESGPNQAHSIYFRLLLIGAGLLGLAAVVSVYKLGSWTLPEASARAEISIIRLTSGVAPESATISTNGDYFAYHELVEGGESLWLQQVGHANRVKIAETKSGESFGSKTFSPDGKLLYFSMFDQEKQTASLYRLPTIGGPRVKILDDVVYPISFSPDGSQFVFLRSNSSGDETSLIIAGKEGDFPRTLIGRKGSTRLVGSPAWSPDGKTILFATTDEDSSISILATDPSGNSPHAVSNERWDNAYRIAWLRDGKGFVAIATRKNDGYSTRRNQVYLVSYPEGVSRRLTSDGLRYQEWSLGVSNDEGIIAIPINRSSQIWSIPADGSSSSAIQLSRGLADGRAGMAALPNGRLAFNATAGEEVGIWSMDGDGSNLKQLSTGTIPIVEEVRADPKGRYIVFSGHKDGSSQLYCMAADGSDLRQLTSGDHQPIDSTVSPDGEKVVYGSTLSGGLSHGSYLYAVGADGGKPERLGSVQCETPHWSPMGDRLSCVDGEDLVVVSDKGDPVRRLRIQRYARINFGAKWTPDGKALAYIRSEEGVGNLWVQPIDGSRATQLTDFSLGDMYNFAFSTDGTRLFVSRGQQISDVILLRNYR